MMPRSAIDPEFGQAMHGKRSTVLAAKSLAIWLAILVAAVANGALREAVLIPFLGRTPGLLLSGLALSALILAIAYLALPWLGVCSRKTLVGVGMAWVVLTLAFEFSFGRYQGRSWSALLEAYSFSDGNIWPLVVLVTAAAPCVAGWLRSRAG